MIKLKTNHLTKYLYLAIILVLTAVLYAKTVGFGFISVWDDNLNVLYNPYIKNLSLDGIRTLFSAETLINEPRFTLFTYAIDYKLWQLNPRMYHLENVMLHLLNVSLAFLLAWRLLRDAKISAMVAALFAFHPFRVESVAWVSGRKDLLFTFFFLMAILFYIQYLKKERILLLLLVMLLAYLSFLSKIQAVALPMTLLLIDVFFKRKITVMMLFEKLLIATMVLFTFFSMADALALLLLWLLVRYRDSYLPRLRFLQKFITNPGKETLRMLLKNALLLFLFWFIYSLLFNAVISQWLRISYAFTLVIASAFIAWLSLEEWIATWKSDRRPTLLFKKHHVWMVFALLLAGALLAVMLKGSSLNLWDPQFTQQFSFADRWFMSGYALFSYLLYAIFPLQLSTLRPYPDFEAAYLPNSYYILSGFAIMLLAAMVWIIIIMKPVSRKLGFGLSFFAVNIFLVLHLIPIEGRVIIAERYTYLAYFGLFMMLAVLLGELKKTLGKIHSAGLLLGVLLCMVFYWISYRGLNTWTDEFALTNEQVSHNPDYPMAYLNRSTLNINKGDYISAISDLDKAIHLNPKFYQAYYNRALSFSRMNIFDKAADDCTLALRHAPGFADAHYLRAFAMAKMHRYTQAIAGYSQALHLNPIMVLAYFNRGNVLSNCCQYNDAINDYNHTIILDPKFPDAYNGRGTALFFKGDYRASLVDYDKAIELNPQNGNYYFNRALSYKGLLQFDKFCADLQMAINLGYQPAQKVKEEQCR